MNILPCGEIAFDYIILSFPEERKGKEEEERKGKEEEESF